MRRRFPRVALAAVLALSVWSIACSRGGAKLPAWGLDRSADFDAGMRSIARSPGLGRRSLPLRGSLRPSGKIVLDERKARWPDAVRDAHAAGARVWVTIVNDVVKEGSPARASRTPDVVHELPREPGAKRGPPRRDLRAWRPVSAWRGVDLDYENLPRGTRSVLVLRPRSGRRAARSAGSRCSVTVQPKTGESSSRGPGAMDWSALCSAADRIQVMFYNQHNASTDPGPVAGHRLGPPRRRLRLDRPAPRHVDRPGAQGVRHGLGAGSIGLALSRGSVLGHRARTSRGCAAIRVDRVPWFALSRRRGDATSSTSKTRRALAAKADVLKGRGLLPDRALVVGQRRPRNRGQNR